MTSTGYRLRWATADDTEALAELADLAHGADEPDGRAPWVAQWVRDLMAPSHPARPGEHLAVVEHLATGRPVAMACVIPQEWTVGAQPVQVGRLEAFGTHPDHRRRGLVRSIMGALHGRCDELGCHLVVISGLSWFYRQFGYDYALEHEGGLCVPPTGEVPETAVRLRPMTEADLPAAARRYDSAAAGSFVWCPRTDPLWRHALHGHCDPSHEAERWWVVECEGEVAGHVAHLPRTEAGVVTVTEFVVGDDVTGPAAVAALASVHDGLAGAYLRLGREHARYGDWPTSTTLPVRPYAWFVRVPDWARLFEATRQAFCLPDRRTVSVGEYVWGLQLAAGPEGIEDLACCPGDTTDVSFPPGTLAKLVLGYRSLDQLLDAYPDAEAGSAGQLLTQLFPLRRSFVRPVS